MPLSGPSTLAPQFREPLMASIGIAIAVECVRLYHQPGLDAFRMTLAGQLLLGRIFSLWNIVAYAIGIAGSALADERFVSSRF